MNIKINLLFDGTRIVEDLESNNHNGIFFVSFNLLKTFLARENYNITLYLARRFYSKSRYIAKKIIPEQTKIITILEKSEFEKNIKKHRYNLQITSNLFKKILFYLKILKNKLRLVQYKYFNDNMKALKKIDAFFSPVYNIPAEIRKHPHIKRFLLIHDIIPLLNLECYNKDQFGHDYFLYDIFEKLDNDYYFFVSESSKRDFMIFTKNQIDEKKLLVTYIATANNFYPQYDSEKISLVLKKYGVDFTINNKYIFSFCSLEPRKNILFTIGCFIKFIEKNKINDFYFFLGGGTWSNFEPEYNKNIKFINDSYKDKVVRLGYIEDADVNILYSNALFFAYISKYEGFGMPPLEAMQAGTPVITSNNSSLPEVVGNSAIMIDCENEQQCIKAFEDLYYNNDLRNIYIKKGIERAKLFTWEKTVNKMSNVIISAVNSVNSDI
jgi:glycosyltransferase involved in cell wall biosynthesis